MSFCRTMKKWTMTKHPTVVIGVAVVVSAAIWIEALSRRGSGSSPALTARVFRLADGWGYDILVNDSLFIHQDCVPGQPGRLRIPTALQARQSAERVIGRFRSGRWPASPRIHIRHPNDGR